MRMLPIAFVAALAVACSHDDATPEFTDPDVPAHPTNPDGVPYPTDGLGGRERGAGHPGDRIPNLAFQAYVDGDRSKGLQTVSLADFYDPQQKRYKVLDIEVSASWCSICAAETDSATAVSGELRKEGAVLLQVMINGNTGSKGPSLDEVDGWVDRHQMNYTLAIDVRGRRMGSLGVTTVPWDILVDTRTMEILDSSAGAPVDVEKYVRDGLAWVASNKPSY